MSDKSYPIARFSKFKPKRMKLNIHCIACGSRASSFVNIEFTYMRGEDEVWNICQRHRDMIKGGNLDNFLSDRLSRGKETP